MDWQSIKQQIDEYIADQSVEIIDEAIKRLQALKAEYQVRDSVGITALPNQTVHVTGVRETVAATAQRQQPRGAEVNAPKSCERCGEQFVPTHHRQKFCAKHRTGQVQQKMKKITDPPLNKKEREWREWAEERQAALSKRPDAVAMPRQDAGV